MTTIFLGEQVKEKFDKFASDWGKYSENAADIVSRMIDTIKEIEKKK